MAAWIQTYLEPKSSILCGVYGVDNISVGTTIGSNLIFILLCYDG